MCNCQSSLCNWRCPKNIHRGLSYLLAFNSEDRRPIWRSQPRLDDEVGIRAYSHLFSPIFLGYSGSFHCHCHCHWLTDFVFVDQTSRLDLHCLSFYLSLHSSGQGAAQCNCRNWDCASHNLSAELWFSFYKRSASAKGYSKLFSRKVEGLPLRPHSDSRFLNFAAELRESVTAAKYRVGMAVGHGSAFRKRGASVSVSRSWCLDLTL